MTIEPVPHEQGRFYAFSDNNPENAYIVDLQWQEHSWSKPKPWCGCFQCMAKGEPVCKHIEQSVAFELRRLGLSVALSSST